MEKNKVIFKVKVNDKQEVKVNVDDKQEVKVNVDDKQEVKVNVDDKQDVKENLEDKVKTKVEEYIERLNPLEKIAYEIAKTRLKTSFDIEKSIGFKTFA